MPPRKKTETEPTEATEITETFTESWTDSVPADPWASDEEKAGLGKPEGTNESVDGSVTDEEFDDGGLFDGVDDIEEVAEDPFFMPDDTYLWRITECVRKRSKSGKMGLNTKLKCEEGPYKGNTQWGPWRRVPLWSDSDFAEAKASGNEDVLNEAKIKFSKAQAQIRQDLTAFGIAVDEMKSVKADKQGNMTALVGLLVKGRVKNVTNEDGTKERKIVAYYLVDEVSGDDGQGGFGQFAGDFVEPEY